jgi:hypothetical protein
MSWIVDDCLWFGLSLTTLSALLDAMTMVSALSDAFLVELERMSAAFVRER